MKRFLLGSASLVAVGLLAFGLAAHAAHPFHNRWTPQDDGRIVAHNSGYVLWDCGPGWETRGTAGPFVESGC